MGIATESEDPNSFLHMETPVCPLKRNLYGHKLAGFLWQKYAAHIIINELGFEKLMSWECLYFHRGKKLFLSVYVDDLKMAGISASIKPMWGLMQVHMKLEPPKKMWENQYLGCAQKPLEPAEEDIEKMGAAFENFLVERGGCSARAAHPDNNKTGPESKFLDEKGSHKIELDDDFIREGKTSRGNVKILKDVAKRISSGKTERKHKVRGYAYDMQGHTELSVTRYLELSGKHDSSLHPVATPCLDDHLLDPADDEKKGWYAICMSPHTSKCSVG